MSPKVKFLTKEDIKREREKNDEDEKNNELFPESKDEKNSDIENTLNNRYNKNKYNASMTENNGMKNSTGMEFNNSLFNLKKTPKKRRPELGQTDNLVNSVKKIFLYNSNKNKPDLYKNIKPVDLK